MKQILLLAFCISVGQSVLAQPDSVFFATNSKLISEIQIIEPIGEDGIRENYTYFKSRYWLWKVDTVSMETVGNTEPEKKKKKNLEYQKYQACDNVINNIRNSSNYWKMRSEVSEIAKQEIGSENEAFSATQHKEDVRLKDFSSKCQAEYKKEINEFKEQLIGEIQRIKQGKIDRYNSLKKNAESTTVSEINTFLKTFDVCKTDQNGLALVIMNNPNNFVKSIDSMSESEFFQLTLKLRHFHETIAISEMKKSLKAATIKSKRKNTVMKKMKYRKK